PLSERADPGLVCRIVRRARQKHADLSHPLALLRARDERPCRTTSNSVDETAPSHCRPHGLRQSTVTAETSTLLRMEREVSPCPLWVKSRHRNGSAECPLYPKSGHSSALSAALDG